MTAKDFLMRARRLQVRIDQLEDARRNVWEKSTFASAKAERETALPEVVSRKTETYGDYVDKIDCERDRLMRVKAEILDIISQVDDNTLAALLTAYYINGKTWEQTAVELKYSYKHIVHALHPQALTEVTRLLERGN